MVFTESIAGVLRGHHKHWLAKLAAMAKSWQSA
jgi:hypothetical protein